MEPKYITRSCVGNGACTPIVEGYICIGSAVEVIETPLRAYMWVYRREEPTLLETAKSAIEYLKSHFHIENVTCLREMKDAIAREKGESK